MRKDIFHHPKYLQKKTLHSANQNSDETVAQDEKKILKKNHILPRKEKSPKPLNPKILREERKRDR